MMKNHHHAYPQPAIWLMVSRNMAHPIAQIKRLVEMYRMIFLGSERKERAIATDTGGDINGVKTATPTSPKRFHILTRARLRENFMGLDCLKWLASHREMILPKYVKMITPVMLPPPTAMTISQKSNPTRGGNAMAIPAINLIMLRRKMPAIFPIGIPSATIAKITTLMV